MEQGLLGYLQCVRMLSAVLPPPLAVVAPPLSMGCHRSIVLPILLAAQHKRAHPALTPTGEGWYSLYLYTGWIEG